MSSIDVLLAAEAAVTGVAQPRASVRHRHLEAEPAVIVTYRMSGEAAAPLGIMYGRAHDKPRLKVAAEPRNREIRFRDVLNPFAKTICEWLGTYVDAVELSKNKTTVRQAPQIFVPNRATATFVGSVFGRSLRYLRTDGDFPLPDTTPLLGNHMTWFEQRSSIPGSSVLLAATDMLNEHWMTGQSGFEKQDLQVLLSWIDPPAGFSGREAAAALEIERFEGTVPAAGPTPDPGWDADLFPLIAKFNERRKGSDRPDVVEQHGRQVHDFVEAALRQTWDATWRAHELLMELPAAAHTERRWTKDRSEWANHIGRVNAQRAFFRKKDSAKQAVWMLSEREDEQKALDAEMAWDDPLILARHLATGDAVLGTVIDVDTSNTIPGKGKAVKKRPLVTLDVGGSCPVSVGTTLYWADNPKMAADVVVKSGTKVVLRVFENVTKPMPVVGTKAAWTTMNDARFFAPSPETDPWTHVGAHVPDSPSEVPA